MSKVTKIEMACGQRPQCCHKVDEYNQRFRARLAKIHGAENLSYGRSHPTRCGSLAKYMVCGLPMCKTHAAKYLLEVALKESEVGHANA